MSGARGHVRRERPRPQCCASLTPTGCAAPDAGLRNLPLHGAAQNQLLLEIVQIALDLLAWIPTLALTGDARR
ncbi:hypothetical protein SAMN04487981_104477 [Streptomyces sp. cf386]|nr:hypothetical protein [Streptomyces sp. cf386]SDN33475.1 hypothetical protein SAMN04487981_104477 [Streptomyces sp. cf386]